MAISPDIKPGTVIGNIQVIEGAPPEVQEVEPEEMLAGALEFMASINERHTTIEYIPTGCSIKETIDSDSLRRDPMDTDEDRRTFLLQKAHELRCSQITYTGPTDEYIAKKNDSNT